MTNLTDVVRFYDEAARAPLEQSLARREEARILHLRNFNNWVKSVLIGDYIHRVREQFGRHVPLRALDMCCGKGGDQIKWAHSDVDHVSFVDVSAASVEVCQLRYNTLRHKRRSQLYTADFHVSDCTVDWLGTGPSDQVYELISCQFALHYSLESYSQAHSFLANVSQCLRSGGYFIATIPNAYEIVRRANQTFSSSETSSESGSIAFGNSVYSVCFPSTSFSVTKSEREGDSPNCGRFTQLHFPLFGARYDFHLEGVVDCPEFLVHPPLLFHLAKEHSLVPATKPVPFAQFFWDSVRRSDRPGDPMDLLLRMRALESLPVAQSDSLEVSPLLHYDHVKHALNTDESCRVSRYVGTLSKEQWDVVDLYSVVAFQKR